MTRIIALGRGGAVDAERIIAILSAHSAPIQRWLARVDRQYILNLTYGYPREAVLVLEGGYVALVSQTVEELAEVLAAERIHTHEHALYHRTEQRFPRP